MILSAQTYFPGAFAFRRKQSFMFFGLAFFCIMPVAGANHLVLSTFNTNYVLVLLFGVKMICIFIIFFIFNIVKIIK
jgi:hypothetical protein